VQPAGQKWPSANLLRISALSSIDSFDLWGLEDCTPFRLQELESHKEVLRVGCEGGVLLLELSSQPPWNACVSATARAEAKLRGVPRVRDALHTQIPPVLPCCRSSGVLRPTGNAGSDPWDAARGVRNTGIGTPVSPSRTSVFPQVVEGIPAGRLSGASCRAWRKISRARVQAGTNTRELDDVRDHIKTRGFVAFSLERRRKPCVRDCPARAHQDAPEVHNCVLRRDQTEL